MAKLFLVSSKVTNDPAGTLYRVQVKVNATEKVNVLAGKLKFSEIVEVKSVKEANSLVNTWLDKPNYDEGNHELIFSGIIPGGYSGEVGHILSLDIRVPFTNNPRGELIWWDRAETKVFLNDGVGTADKIILENLSNARLLSVSLGHKEVVDTTAPETFNPLISKSSDLFAGKNFIAFSTVDKQSGVDHYELAEKQSWFAVRASRLDWQKVESPFVLEDQKLSSYIYVKAVDQAGNERIEVIHPSAPTFPFHPYFFFSIIIIMAIGLAFFSWRKFFSK